MTSQNTKIKPKLLIIDDDESLLTTWKRVLGSEFNIITAYESKKGLHYYVSENPDIVLLDIKLHEEIQDDRSGVDVLRKALEFRPGTPIIMISAYGDVTTAVECMQTGAVDFIEKQRADIVEIKQRIHAAISYSRLKRRAKELEDELNRKEPFDLVGKSLIINEIKDVIKIVAQDGYATVLIRGETGTGKELVAHAIHKMGWRSNDPFVAVNIGALNRNLIESELFGHEVGAFTDAKKRRIGYIEKANGGILFLDEIGDLPLDVQSKLLRFLETRSFNRIGSTDEIKVNLQIVAATNQDLEEEIKRGQFREDLFFRIESFEIQVPPLRKRKEDIQWLVEYFLSMFKQQGRTTTTEISPKAMDDIVSYDWPGNVRELKGVLERAIIYSKYRNHSSLEREDLSLDISKADSDSKLSITNNEWLNIDLDEELARIELNFIEEALRKTGSKKTEAWKILGLNDRFALRRRIKSIQKKYKYLTNEFQLIKQSFEKNKN